MIDFEDDHLAGVAPEHHDLFPENATLADMLDMYHGHSDSQAADSHVPKKNLLLVVEDSPPIALLTRMRVKKLLPEFEVAMFDRAEDLIVFAATQANAIERTAAIITDINLPMMTGTNLVRVLNGREAHGLALPAEAVNALRWKPMFLHSDSRPDHPHIQHVMKKGYAHGFLPKLPDSKTFTAIFRRGLLRALMAKVSTRDGKKSQ